MSQKVICALVGMKYSGADSLVRSLPSGEQMTLVRESTNGHDPNAVQVWFKSKRVGYIARSEVPDVARYMDKAKTQIMPARLIFHARQPQVEVLL